MSGVVLPPFLSLLLSSQRTFCLGSFLSFFSVFSAGLPQLSGARERRACFFGWTLLRSSWNWHCFHINKKKVAIRYLIIRTWRLASIGTVSIRYLIMPTTDISQPGMSISVAFLAQRFIKVSYVFLLSPFSLFLSLSLSSALCAWVLSLLSHLFLSSCCVSTCCHV
jgi:hypothetical protein